MSFDILRQVNSQLAEINQKVKKEDSDADEIKLDSVEISHLNELEGALEKVSSPARRFMDDANSLKKKGIDTSVVVNSIIKEVQTIFKVR